MKNKAVARILTILILTGVVGAVVARKSGFGLAPITERPEAKPQDTVYAMLEAARNGDVARYLKSYTGPMAESLARAKSESPDFSRYLRDSNAGIKGIAVMEPQPEPDGQFQLRVEYVYQDRNEAQFFFLAKTPDGWKISRVETSEPVKTLIPYGTPVQ